MQELSTMIEMFYILNEVLVTYMYTIVRLNQFIRFMYSTIIIPL